jgi:broad specificity phosphatase PhoE
MTQTRHYRGRHAAPFATILFLIITTVVGTGSLDAAGAGPKPTPNGYEVLFVRHAEADPPDGPLSDLGFSQAADLADLLHDEPVNAAYTSMLLRAFQTGIPVASDHELPVVADARINEMNLDLTNIPPQDIPAVVGQRFFRWLNGEDRDEGFGGESFNELHARWDDWWSDFVTKHRTDKGAGVVVAHGALLILMLPETCHNALDPGFVLGNGLQNTAIVKARLHPNGTLSCTEWAGVPVPT